MSTNHPPIKAIFTSAWNLLLTNNYQSAGSFFKETLPEGFHTGCLTLLTSNLEKKLFLRIIAKIIVSLLEGNESTMVFIDGANSFPYYDVSIETKRKKLSPSELLDRIKLSRAFNSHQMTELINIQLPKTIQTNPSTKIVFVNQLTDTYFSKETLQYLQYDDRSSKDSIIELNTTIGTLKHLALQHDLIVIITSSSIGKTKTLGGTYLMHSAAVIINLSKNDRSKVSLTLQKHPCQAFKTTSLIITETRDHRQVIPLTNFF